MKRLIAILAFGLCMLFVVYSAPVMDAARQGLTLWWQAVLPTLLPFFVCATLIERTGALSTLAHGLNPLSKALHIPPYALPVLLLGGIAGYPSGARLSAMLLGGGAISQEEAERLGTACNLVSPMFLMGALCTGMLNQPALFLPLALGHYGSALLVALLLPLIWPIAKHPLAFLPQRPAEHLYVALPGAISDGVTGLIKVGGSIVFFLVLAKIMEVTGLLRIFALPVSLISKDAALAAPGFISGLLEFTGGCHILSQVGFSPRLTATLCCFLVSFGGLSVLAQAMAFLPMERPLRYIVIKLLQGAFAALLVWFAFPLMPGAAETIAGPDPLFYAQNAYTGLSMLLSSLLGLSIPLLLARVAARRRR